MLTYTFSRREKVLITLFAILLMVIGWYQLVYVNATDQIRMLESKIETVEVNISTAQTKLAKKAEMESVIEQRIAEGAKTTPIPDYDNIKPLMAELDTIMAKATSYTLQFESIDMESGEYIHRGVNMHFECGSYEEAEEIMRAIVEGSFPCIIDAVDMDTSTMSSARINSADVVMVIHVIFYERAPRVGH